ncbi:hypothetical protein M0805_005304 [Coniferiporia weirii]|nr:hypothetical protein M0805_005304 [Coniferiporia weirii]
MPHYDGPYTVLVAFPEKLEYTPELPDSDQTFPGFHASQLQCFIPNNDMLFPGWALAHPGPVDKEWNEFEVDSIVDEHKQGHGTQFLVRWKGWENQGQEWKSWTELQESALLVLEAWEQRQGWTT